MVFISHFGAFLNLAAKNLCRRVVRTTLTMIGVALAVSVSVSLAGFVNGYRSAITRSIDMLGFQVMVMAKGCPYEAATMMLKGGTGLLYLPEEIYHRIAADQSVASLTPVFVGIAEKEQTSIRDDSTESLAVISGIEVASFIPMKPWLTFQSGPGFDGGRWFNSTTNSGTKEVVLGYEVAQFEQRKVGDLIRLTITPAGSLEPTTAECTVVGILARTGTQDDGTIFMDIGESQRLFSRPGQLTVVGVKMREFSSAAISQFEQRWITLPEVQIVGLQQVKTTLLTLVGNAQTMVAAVALIAVFVAIIGVVNTILMSIYERTAEIGIMKAIGAKRGDIFELIWYETVMLCVGGGIAGIVIAFIGSGLVELLVRHLIDVGVPGDVVLITLPMMGIALTATIIVGFFAGLYPAWRASSMRPLEAIRAGE